MSPHAGSPKLRIISTKEPLNIGHFLRKINYKDRMVMSPHTGWRRLTGCRAYAGVMSCTTDVMYNCHVQLPDVCLLPSLLVIMLPCIHLFPRYYFTCFLLLLYYPFPHLFATCLYPTSLVIQQMQSLLSALPLYFCLATTLLPISVLHYYMPAAQHNKCKVHFQL